MTVNDATFTRNTATFGGGALYNWDGLTATGDTFNGNSAEIGRRHRQRVVCDSEPSTFRGNKATTDGGGMFSGYQAAVSDSSFDQNQAGSGGGIDYGPGALGLTATMSVTGSHLTGNHAADGGGIDNGPGEGESTRAPRSASPAAASPATPPHPTAAASTPPRAAPSHSRPPPWTRTIRTTVHRQTRSRAAAANATAQRPLEACRWARRPHSQPIHRSCAGTGLASNPELPVTGPEHHLAAGQLLEVHAAEYSSL